MGRPGPRRGIRAAAAKPLVGAGVAAAPTTRRAPTPVHPPLPGLPTPEDRVATNPSVALCQLRGSRTLRPPRDQPAADPKTGVTEPACPFCSPPADQLFHHGRLVV